MTSLHRVLRGGLALALALVGAASEAAVRIGQAQSASPTLEPPGRAQTFDALQGRVNQVGSASTSGALPVIVEVRAGFTPEGDLAGAQAVTDQRAGIARAQGEVERALAAVGTSQVRKFEYIPFMSLRADAQALNALRASPWVVSVAEDVPERVALAESTALIGASTPTTGTWALGYAGAGQVVAILDTGVDKNHPFLTGKVVAEACFSNQGIPSADSFCPGGAASSTAPGSGLPCNVDGCEHGTHVAGIAAGKAYAGMENDNVSGQSFSGVARDAQIIAIQVFTRFTNSQTCGGSPPCALTYPSDQAAALNYVYSLRNIYNIAAANMSLGGSLNNTTNCDSDLRKSSIDLLASVRVATVVASGNNGFTNGLSTPACISTAISVGSTRDGGPGATPVDTVSSFSNSASFLSLLAPGEFIESSIPNGFFDLFEGTSMATPHVAGAWAVLRQAAPTARVSDILNALLTSGVAITDSRNGVTKPRIQLNAALGALPPPVHFLENNAYSFGQIVIDLKTSHTFTLLNPSSVPLSLSAPGLTGAGVSFTGGAFPGTGGTCSTSAALGPGASCTISLTYAPTTLGTLAGALSLTYTPSDASATTLQVALGGAGVELCTDNLIDNAVFERLNANWGQADTVSGNALPVLCTTGTCTVGGFAPAGPYSGLGWVWFGGYTSTLTTTVTQIVTQSVTIPSGTATLQFNLNISRADPGTGITDTLRALIDSTPVFTATAAEQAAYQPYTLVRLNLNAFATGLARTLTFSATTTATGPVVNFNLDDVAVCSPAHYPTYLPWVSR